MGAVYAQIDASLQAPDTRYGELAPGRFVSTGQNL